MTVINPSLESSAALIVGLSTRIKIIGSTQEYLLPCVASCLRKVMVSAIKLLSYLGLENCEPKIASFIWGLMRTPFPI